jgi:hypothetical protein
MIIVVLDVAWLVETNGAGVSSAFEVTNVLSFRAAVKCRKAQERSKLIQVRCRRDGWMSTYGGRGPNISKFCCDVFSMPVHPHSAILHHDDLVGHSSKMRKIEINMIHVNPAPIWSRSSWPWIG